MSQTKPTIALFTGDPAGIGPELIEKLLNRSDTQEKANIILIGQKNVFDFPSTLKFTIGPASMRPHSKPVMQVKITAHT